MTVGEGRVTLDKFITQLTQKDKQPHTLEYLEGTHADNIQTPHRFRAILILI